MNVLRGRPSRVLLFALGVSVLAHAVLLPFVRVPAAAQVATKQKLLIVDVLSPPTPHPTPRVRSTPPPPTPRPIVAHPPAARPLVVGKPARVVAVVPPRATTVSAQTQSNHPARTGVPVSGDGGPVGLAYPQGGSPETGGPQTSPIGPIEATPAAGPAPIESKCPSEPHDATVTQAVTPDRPQGAAEEDAVGRVVVEVQLARDGSVAHASLHKSSGYTSLDNAAIAAAAQARYAPASDGCEAISGTYLYVVDFSE